MVDAERLALRCRAIGSGASVQSRQAGQNACECSLMAASVRLQAGQIAAYSLGDSSFSVMTLSILPAASQLCFCPRMRVIHLDGFRIAWGGDRLTQAMGGDSVDEKLVGAFRGDILRDFGENRVCFSLFVDEVLQKNFNRAFVHGLCSYLSRALQERSFIHSSS